MSIITENCIEAKHTRGFSLLVLLLASEEDGHWYLWVITLILNT